MQGVKKGAPLKRKKAILAIKAMQATSIKDAMLQAGYSETSAAHNQHLVTKSKEYKEYMSELEEYGITIPNIAKRHNTLLNSTDEKVAIQAVQIGYKVHGVYDKSASNTFNAPVMIQINPPKDPRIAPHSSDSGDE